MSKAPTVKVHPLGECLACKLMGIGAVPHGEQSKMVFSAIKAACKLYDERVADLEAQLAEAKAKSTANLRATNDLTQKHIND